MEAFSIHQGLNSPLWVKLGLEILLQGSKQGEVLWTDGVLDGTQFPKNWSIEGEHQPLQHHESEAEKAFENFLPNPEQEETKAHQEAQKTPRQ